MSFKPEFTIDGINFFWGGEERKRLTEDTINFEYKEGDIIVAGYPRGGTTFRRQMIWLVAYDGDVERAKHEQLRDRCPSLDRYTTEDGDLEACEKARRITDGPRVMLSHLPCNLMTKAVDAGAKIIYLLRNPKDTIVSSYHALSYFLPQVGSRFADMDFDGTFQMMSGDFDRGNMISHAYSYWKHRDNPNFLFLHYEEDKADYEGAVRKVAKFLGKELTQKQIDDIVDFISFDKFKKHMNEEAVVAKGRDPSQKDNFVRKGAVGEWKHYFKVAQNEYLDRVIEKRCEGDVIPWIYE